MTLEALTKLSTKRAAKLGEPVTYSTIASLNKYTKALIVVKTIS